jgi:hypothetical protein
MYIFMCVSDIKSSIGCFSKKWIHSQISHIVTLHDFIHKHRLSLAERASISLTFWVRLDASFLSCSKKIWCSKLKANSEIPNIEMDNFERHFYQQKDRIHNLRLSSRFHTSSKTVHGYMNECSDCYSL